MLLFSISAILIANEIPIQKQVKKSVSELVMMSKSHLLGL